MEILKHSFFLLVAFIAIAFKADGQNPGKISGTITGTGDKASAATAVLLRAKDSATLKLTVADKQGAFVFDMIADGKYIVLVTAVGYQKYYSDIVEVSAQQPGIELPPIQLQALTKKLADVTVKANRPLIEQRIDRTIVNVDASITNAGTSALEVLEKSPGVSVDREGNISLKGKEGVLVLVDGRPTQLTGPDLANLLRSMNSSQLDQIEIMTNPPARYDAQGNSGIINIKTKKIITAGYNGTASFNYSQGRYPKVNEGLNFNFREKKVNLFANLSHNYRKTFETLTVQRNIRSNTNILENYFDQQSDKLVNGNSWNGKAGLDFFATKKTTLGLVVNATSGLNTLHNQNITNIFTPSKEIVSITEADVNNRHTLNNFSGNLNYRTTFDTKGREISTDLDYVTYRSTQTQSMVNAYPYTTGPVIKPDSLNGHLPQIISVYSGRVDYVHPLKNKARFEAGIKSSIVRTDNNANYDSIQNGIAVHDLNRSNHFIYKENINAAYVNMSIPLDKKLTAQLGLRLENTNAEGRQITSNENFDRHYTQLFPTAYLQYKANEKNTFVANYGRRVRRPSYQSLNPFIRFMDRYTYSQGNPNLKPSLSNNFELTHTWRSILTTTLNYTSTNDIFNNVIEQKGQEAYSKPANIASLRQVGISVNSNNALNKWWTSNINLNAFHNTYKGVVNDAMINQSATSYILMVTQQFKVSKTLTAELSGRLRNGWLEGVMRAKPIGFIWAGVSQQVMKNKGTVRLTVRDIFYTQKFKATGRYGNVDFDFQELNDSRLLVIGFTYRFNKGKKIAPTKRTEGSVTDEQDRIGGQ